MKVIKITLLLKIITQNIELNHALLSNTFDSVLFLIKKFE